MRREAPKKNCLKETMADKAEPYPKRRRRTITEPEGKPSHEPEGEPSHDTICPLVLKIMTEPADGVESTLILYDPPSSAHRTSWDDGKLGNSLECKLEKLSKEEKIQYVLSLIKLTRDAGEIISNGREFSEILLVIGEFYEIVLHMKILKENSSKYASKYEFQIEFNRTDIPEPHIRYDPINVSGTIKDSEVKFKKREENKLDYIADVLTKDYLLEKCKGTQYVRLEKFKIWYPDGEKLKFKATLCIKRRISDLL
jgi:hypothetical protein